MAGSGMPWISASWIHFTAECDSWASCAPVSPSGTRNSSATAKVNRAGMINV